MPRATNPFLRSLTASAAALLLLASLAAGCGEDESETTTGGPTPSPGGTASPRGTGGTTGADSGTGTVPADAASLEGRTFVSTSVTGHDLVPGTTIRLDVDGGRLAVAAGCNTMSGEFAVEDGTLRWTSMPAATMMGCEPELMAQDEWLAGLLTTGVAAVLDGDTLVLTQDDLRIELTAEPEAAITGTVWVLDGIVRDDAVSSLPAGVEAPTLDIAEDGTATFTTGCNTGTASVEVTEIALVFRSVSVTERACEGHGAEVEAAVLAVLDGPADLAADGTTLTLGKGPRGLVYRASR